MNRRQKMKRMKQELEWYKKQMVPTREVGVDMREMRVETLRVVDYAVDRGNGLPEHAIVSYLMKGFRPHLRPYLTIHKEEVPSNEFGRKYRYSAELRVVVPHGGDDI